MPAYSEQKILLVHPFLNYYGGAEYMLRIVANDIFPQANVFTFSYNEKVAAETKINERRIVSPIGKGIAAKFYRQTTPLYPALIDTQNFDEYDTILSFSYAYVHGLVTTHDQLHISYIQTPMRLLWLNESAHYWYDKVPLVRELYRSILAWQRVWDRQAGMRPDYLVSNSAEVQQRVSTFWGRTSAIIHPPVDTEFYAPKSPVQKEEYFVTHGRLVRYKKIDVLIEACKAKHKKLVIIGDGPEYSLLKKLTKGSSDITFTGYVTHEEKRALLQKAQGFLFASHEDFGIAPVEALAAGTPVLAYGKGGALETITPDTGMYFKEQSVDSLASQLEGFGRFCTHVNKAVLRKQADKFSKATFIQQYKKFVSDKSAEYDREGPPLVD